MKGPGLDCYTDRKKKVVIKKLVVLTDMTTMKEERLRGNIMDIQTLTTFLMWCTIINGSLLILWTMAVLLVPEYVYRTQRFWFPISRETFNVVFYSFLGLFKIVWLIFNVGPYVALLIIGKK